MKDVELFNTYITDTTTLLNEYDNILKKRNSLAFLDVNSLNELYRIMHTIKASSSTIELNELVLVAHNVENILDYLSKFGNSCLPHSTVIDLLFKTEYYFRSKLKSVIHNTPDDDHTEFENELSKFIKLIPQNSITPINDPNKLIPFTRMFELMERTVSDMSKKLAKKVKLVTSGESVKARREIIDSITIPVLHLIRNAMDHGIETPDERIACGKPKYGVISITAGTQEDVLFVTVANDGKHLDFDFIADFAQRKRLLKKPVEEYTRKELSDFILVRGFSTKEDVSEFSGRGVGLDIVKTSIYDMGGTIFINDTDSGLSITLAIPDNKEIYN